MSGSQWKCKFFHSGSKRWIKLKPHEVEKFQFKRKGDQCFLRYGLLPSLHSCLHTACVYTLCVFSVCVCVCVCVCGLWTESRGSSGAALYPRLILIYVKAMAHWRACTIVWSASGMCQRPVSVCVHVDSGRGLDMRQWSACTLQSQPLTFSTYAHKHTHTHTHTQQSNVPQGLTYLHTTVCCGVLQFHSTPKTSQQSFYNSASWHVLFNGLWVGHESTWWVCSNQCRLGGFYLQLFTKDSVWIVNMHRLICRCWQYGLVALCIFMAKLRQTWSLWDTSYVSRQTKYTLSFNDGT